MKFLILLSIILHISYAIDIKFNQFYYKGIQRIEIPSCNAEPCLLHIGQQLPVKVTFEAEKIGDKTDIGIRAYTPYYRDLYQYTVVQHNSLCKMQLIECPIVAKHNYTIDIELMIYAMDRIITSESIPETGIKDVYFNIGFTEGEMIGSAIFKINVQY